jgi:hypothetical protein
MTMTDEMMTATLELIDAIENSDDVSPPIVPAFQKLKRSVPEGESVSDDETLDGIRAVLNAAEGEFLDKNLLTAIRSMKTHMRPIERKVEKENEKNIEKLEEAAIAQIEEVRIAIQESKDRERIIAEYQSMEEARFWKMKKEDADIEKEKEAVKERALEWEKKNKAKK